MWHRWAGNAAPRSVAAPLACRNNATISAGHALDQDRCPRRRPSFRQGVPLFAGMMLLGVLLCCFCGVMPSALPALFPTSVRYSALAIGFNVSVSLFGGTPLVAAWLVGATGNLMMPAYYLMGAAARAGSLGRA